MKKQTTLRKRESAAMACSAEGKERAARFLSIFGLEHIPANNSGKVVAKSAWMIR
jgi:hypothetical protein